MVAHLAMLFKLNLRTTFIGSSRKTGSFNKSRFPLSNIVPGKTETTKGSETRK